MSLSTSSTSLSRRMVVKPDCSWIKNLQEEVARARTRTATNDEGVGEKMATETAPSKQMPMRLVYVFFMVEYVFFAHLNVNFFSSFLWALALVQFRQHEYVANDTAGSARMRDSCL